MTQPNPQPAAKSDNTFWIYLSYLFWWILGLVGLATVKDDARVRFHCAQAIVLSAAVTAVVIVLSILSGAFIFTFLWRVFSTLNWLVVLAYYAYTIYIMLMANQGKDIRVPIAADFAEKNVMNLFK